ncbi:alkaline phosphatase family protein [Chryseobacterium capnotolerans]|uniref:alkaline phosphatase family protein n=1 Tax=Chryseobacterium capnotolerans TaxID=2759528 RepID=UPI0024B613B8|nr:alkaline phosphatase family protein [Chryseobacterium capnotolerans]
MKRGIHFLLLFISFTIFGQQGIADTAQVVVPGRHNSIENQSKPYVIMISTDGFRYDYAKKYNAENLLKLSENGVKAEAMIPSYPSITFPNHWSLITGLYPSHHGLIDNFFYDYKRKETYAMSNKKMQKMGAGTAELLFGD